MTDLINFHYFNFKNDARCRTKNLPFILNDFRVVLPGLQGLAKTCVIKHDFRKITNMKPLNLSAMFQTKYIDKISFSHKQGW